MKVKTVEYSRLKSYGTFNNIKVGCTVELDDGESPSLGLARAQSWVHRELERMIGKQAMALDTAIQQRQFNFDEENF